MARTYTAPGLSEDAAGQICDMLKDRLNSLMDLSLTLKHIHWNVVGQQFIAVHQMLDDQVAAVQTSVDEVAGRRGARPRLSGHHRGSSAGDREAGKP